MRLAAGSLVGDLRYPTMRVCHCHGITDREIRSCVRAGAACVEAIGQACGAGASCGGCKPLVAWVVEKEQRRFSALNESGLRAHLPAVLAAG